MAIRIDELLFNPDSLGAGETSVMASFKARTGVMTNHKVVFRISVEEGLPIFIVDPDGNQVKMHQWSQTIMQNFEFYEMEVVFVVTARLLRGQACQVILDATDAQNNDAPPISGILFLN